MYIQLNSIFIFDFFFQGSTMDSVRALEVMGLLQEKITFLTGGRDKRGAPVVTFPSTPRRERAKLEDYRRLLQYFGSIPP